ncbi:MULTISPECIES: hypothetical protein [Streptomyces]|uniref:hypothetical protein n=1 Tax=Streptomyces TaxID=1883 RepID=UPI001EFA468F|nr:hypothetical protein [Streptomyces sp. CL12-4]MCG8970518.1 hypothetical protein [Streptomyces sp. CL12-4]
MSQSRVGVVGMSIGVALIAAGAAMYVLPGPGLPVLLLGLTALAAGGGIWFIGRKSAG